jgi:hypothetical protein
MWNYVLGISPEIIHEQYLRPQNWSGSFEEEKKFLVPTGNETLDLPTCSIITILITLPWLPYTHNKLIIRSIKNRFSIKKNVSTLQQSLPPNFAD